MVLFKTTIMFSTSTYICGCNVWLNRFKNFEYTVALKVDRYLEVQQLTGQLILITVTIVYLEYVLFPSRFSGSRTKGA